MLDYLIVGAGLYGATFARQAKDTGRRVLVIDADSQCNASDSLRADYKGKKTLYELMINPSLDPNTFIQHGPFVDVIAGSPELDEMEYLSRVEGSPIHFGVLDSIIQRINGYDSIWIDTNPSLNFSLRSAAYAASRLILVMRPDRYSVSGFTQMMQFAYEMRDEFNPDLQVEGVLLTQYNSRTIAHSVTKDVITRYGKEIGVRVFDRAVRNSIVIADAQADRSPITAYKPNHEVSLDYEAIYRELKEGEANNGR